MTEPKAEHDLLAMTADIVSSYLTHNPVRAAELPELIATVHSSLAGISGLKAVEEPAVELKPAVPVKKSVTQDFIISLEDGRKFKSLKRHLSGLGMTPNDYRRKWGLPPDYPMVAPGYSAIRSEAARSIGLGSRSPVPRAEVSAATSPTSVEEPAKKRSRRQASA